MRSGIDKSIYHDFQLRVKGQRRKCANMNKTLNYYPSHEHYII